MKGVSFLPIKNTEFFRKVGVVLVVVLLTALGFVSGAAAASPHVQRGYVPRQAERPAAAFLNADGTISNAYWGIVPNSQTAADNNTKYFTAALSYCAQNGYATAKVEKGTYYVNAYNSTVFYGSPHTISLPSQLDVDLNGATFVQVTTSAPAYSIFTIEGQDNVKLRNGTLIGDKNTHIYKGSEYDTHEWGFGVHVRGSNNVVIDNLNVSNMTGDAVMIIANNTMEQPTVGAISRNITVANSVLHDCRRQGISVVGAEGVLIRGNTIYGIKGTAPQAGIDLEGELDWPVRDVTISGNTIRGGSQGVGEVEENLAVTVHKNSENITINGNEIVGWVGMIYGDTILIADNTISSGGVVATDTNKPVNITVERNKLRNATIRIYMSRWAVVRGNVLTNGIIELSFANGAVYDNKISNTSRQKLDYGLIIYAENDRKGAFKAFDLGNTFTGQFASTAVHSAASAVKVSTSRIELANFLAQIEKSGPERLGLRIPPE
jgi:hypothetical protein